MRVSNTIIFGLKRIIIFQIDSHGKFYLSHIHGELKLDEESLAKLKGQNITELSISNGKITLSDRNVFGHLDSLEKLTLKQTGLESFPKLGKTLMYLDLSDNKISELGENALESANSLLEMNLRRKSVVTFRKYNVNGKNKGFGHIDVGIRAPQNSPSI